jgi:hypothetical protein
VNADVVYTICLILIAMITVSAFDGDVWIRDIDSTPSPFPMPIILEFIRPRTGRRNHAYPTRTGTPQPAHGQVCVSPCTCPTKPTQSQLDSEQPEFPCEEERLKKPKSLPHLIRIPNAAEQRASIAVSFEVVGRFS